MGGHEPEASTSITGSKRGKRRSTSARKGFPVPYVGSRGANRERGRRAVQVAADWLRPLQRERCRRLLSVTGRVKIEQQPTTKCKYTLMGSRRNSCPFAVFHPPWG